MPRPRRGAGAARENDLDLVGPGHDVLVGHDRVVSIPDDPAALPLAARAYHGDADDGGPNSLDDVRIRPKTSVEVPAS